VSQSREVNDEMFLIAAQTLASCVSEERLAQGAIFPRQDDLRKVSLQIACAVVRYARDARLGRAIPDGEIEAATRNAIWYPGYIPILAQR